MIGFFHMLIHFNSVSSAKAFSSSISMLQGSINKCWILLKWLVKNEGSKIGKLPQLNIKPFKFGNSVKISIGKKSIAVLWKMNHKVFVAFFWSGLPLKLNLSFLAVMFKFAFFVEQTRCFGHWGHERSLYSQIMDWSASMRLLSADSKMKQNLWGFIIFKIGTYKGSSIRKEWIINFVRSILNILEIWEGKNLGNLCLNFHLKFPFFFFFCKIANRFTRNPVLLQNWKPGYCHH